jgi:hypothetical protein
MHMQEAHSAKYNCATVLMLAMLLQCCSCCCRKLPVLMLLLTLVSALRTCAMRFCTPTSSASSAS